MIKVTAIKGSPRQQGYSSSLLEKFIESFQDKLQSCSESAEIDYLFPFEMDIKACKGCFSCSQTAICVFEDDMRPLIQGGKFDESDVIILATPIFFNGLPSHVKKLIDRCQPIYASKYDLGNSIIDREKERKALLIACAGAPAYTDQFTAATSVSDMFFKTLNSDKFEELLIPDTDSFSSRQPSRPARKAAKIGQKLAAEFIDEGK